MFKCFAYLLIHTFIYSKKKKKYIINILTKHVTAISVGVSGKRGNTKNQIRVITGTNQCMDVARYLT